MIKIIIITNSYIMIKNNNTDNGDKDNIQNYDNEEYIIHKFYCSSN